MRMRSITQRYVFLVACAAVYSILLVIAQMAFADQMICFKATAFDRSRSDLVDVNGNKWQEINDAQGLFPVGMTAPGRNGTDGGDNRPWLVFKLPVAVKAGEATSDGKTWNIWLHMRVSTDANSFYWQSSANAELWGPTPIDNTLRVNDDAMNNTDVWAWTDNVTGNDGGKPVPLVVGTNYIRIASRESKADAPGSPRFDAVCLRNYGGIGIANAPKDNEVAAMINSTPVEPRGKLSTTWGELRATHQ